MSEIDTRHVCPWPACTRVVEQDFWGCIEHWQVLPMDLRQKISRAKNSQGWLQEVASREATAWIADHVEMQRLFADRAKQMAGEFAAGVTLEGRVFLIWPGKNEYLTLTREESQLMLKAVRAMVAPAIDPPAKLVVVTGT